MAPIYIRHRVNSKAALAQVEKDWGVEIDLRSQVNLPGSLHLSHDPWILGESFEDWLKEFVQRGIRGPIWLNTKEDGLEERIETLLSQFGITQFVFLDTVLPTLVKKTQVLNQRFLAIRLSEYEPIEFVQKFRNRADWVWVDCFQGSPVHSDWVATLKPHFKICLVSPELHGKSLEGNISQFFPLLKLADAVCTKEPKVWMKNVPSK